MEESQKLYGRKRSLTPKTMYCMIHLRESLEKSKTIYRQKAAVWLLEARGGKREQGVNGAKGVFQGEGTILYIDFGGGYLIIHNYQNSSNCTLKIVDNTLVNKNEQKQTNKQIPQKPKSKNY